jgi:hypothetical protein
MPIVRRERVQWFPGLMFVVVGAGLLFEAAHAAQDVQQFLEKSVRVEGVVSKLNAGGAHPEIEFALPSGKRVSFPESGWISYRAGQRVHVLHLPDDPEGTARLDDPGALFFWYRSGAFAGLVFCVLGIGAAFLRESEEADETRT